MRDAETLDPSDVADRRLFRCVITVGILLFLAIWAVVPNIGPTFRSFYSASASMEPTIEYRQTVYANRLAYGLSRHSYEWFPLPISGRWPNLEPIRGDVIVFIAPNGSDHLARVIGLSGDHVKLDHDKLWINGEPVSRVLIPSVVYSGRQIIREHLPEGRSFTHYETVIGFGETPPPLATTPTFVVPAHHIFVMGDNRDNAADSRLAPEKGGVGFVPVENIIGRIEFVYDR